MKEMFEEKVNGKISRISLLIVALMVMFAIAGCGGKNDSKEKETTTAGSTIAGSVEENTKENVEGTVGDKELNGDFDFSQVFDNIEINGKKVPFPFTLNDLGDGYEFEYITDMGDGTYSASVFYEGKDTYMDAYVRENEEKDVNVSSQIFRICVYNQFTQDISINGIDFASTEEEIKNAFVDLPTKCNKDGEMAGFWISDSKNKFDISVSDGKIGMMIIIKGDE